MSNRQTSVPGTVAPRLRCPRGPSAYYIVPRPSNRSVAHVIHTQCGVCRLANNDKWDSTHSVHNMRIYVGRGDG